MEGIYNFFGFLAPVVARMLEGIHLGLSKVFPSGSGWAWGLSIVFLTITIRILIFPLFVRQVKSQRRMQELAPKVRELQKKHQGDRETLNTELMKLYKDHGTNPISGCMPMLLQMPVFFALFRVMNEFKPRKDGSYEGLFGLSDRLVEEGAKAKVFGAPISATFLSGDSLLAQLNGNRLTVQIVAIVMIVTMGASQFWVQRQIMARAGGPVDPQQAQIQKLMLYVLPVFFAVAGVNFPIGVLLYWLTTNIWSMGQQAYVIKRMPPVVPSAPPGKPGAKKEQAAKKAAGSSEQPAATAAVTTAPPPKPAQQRATSGRAAGSRKNKNKKRRR